MPTPTTTWSCPAAWATSVARSLVSPLPINAAVDTLDAEAHSSSSSSSWTSITRACSPTATITSLAYVVGARYAKLNQEFNALFEVNGFETVATDVEFEGAGPEVRPRRRALRPQPPVVRLRQGRTWPSSAANREPPTSAPTRPTPSIVDTSWEAGRLVTMTDLEVGLGWQNCCGNFRLSAGYSTASWFNIVRTNEWINAVQLNNFTDGSDNCSAS